MKKETLTKIAIASVLCAPSCATERGVVIDRQDLPDERALYVNLIRKNKAKQKPLVVQPDGMYEADRKLFFMDSTYLEPFLYVLPGDTIYVNNPLKKTYLEMGRGKKHIIRINDVREKQIVKTVRLWKDKQK